MRNSWPAQPTAVPAARRAVREHVLAGGHEDLLDAVEIVLSELVGNVVVHVGGDVVVEATVDADAVQLEVSDRSPVTPHLRVFSQVAATGRGMRLVHALSSEYGLRPEEEGKTIWVRITRASAVRGDEELEAEFAEIDWLDGLT
jgi:anti-sigma regulatory factor (Ser/Thr protein kinase)